MAGLQAFRLEGPGAALANAARRLGAPAVPRYVSCFLDVYII
jgi:hypothetical protein